SSAEIVEPHLGGQKDLVARHARSAYALPYIGLVAVHRGRIDVPIADPQRLAHHAGGGVASELPGAEPDDRDACAVRFDGLHGASFWKVSMWAEVSCRMSCAAFRGC